jgi:PAS domain S-box-containing protein
VLEEFIQSVAEEKAYSSKFRYMEANGEYVHYLSNGIPRFNEKSILIGYIGVLINVEQHEQVHSFLESKITQSREKLIQRNEELKLSEARYHKMIAEVQDYAIILLSPDGIIQNWNVGAQLIKGYSTVEIIGKHFSLFYTKEDRHDYLPEKLLAQAIKSGKATHEGWRVRKDGTRFWGSVAITALHDDNHKIIGFSKVTRDLTIRKAAEDALKQKNQELEEMNHELS